MDLNAGLYSLESYSGGSDQTGVPAEFCRDNLRPFTWHFEGEFPQCLSHGIEQNVAGGYHPAANNDHLGVEQVGQGRETYPEEPAGLGKDFSCKLVAVLASVVHVF